MRYFVSAVVLFGLLIISVAFLFMKGYAIKGTLKGLPNGTKLYLVKSNKVQNKLDTLSVAVASKEHFEFTGNLAREGCWSFIMINEVPSKKYLSLLLENATITITSDADSWPVADIRGSIANDDYLSFIKSSAPYQETLKTLKETYQQQGNTMNADMKKDLSDKMKAVADSITLIRQQFIATHPASLYTAFLVRTTSQFTWERKEEEYNKLSTQVKASSFGTELKEDIDLLKKQATITPGGMMPDFTAFTPQGKQVSAYDILKKSKYTLIDFWASWCGPCRKATPDIKKVYDAFHEKGFNVLSISLDFPGQEKAWKEAIAKDGMTWEHVSNLKGRESEEYKLFGLDGIPAYILVDQQGKILALDMPGATISAARKSQEKLRGDALYQKIASLMP